MCSGFEPLLFEAGGEALAGDMFLGDMAATGAGEGLAGMGAAEMGAGASLGMGATDMSLGAAGAGNAASYLSQLGGLDSVLGSQFASDLAPFTSSATDVASITGNAVPGLENNIGSFDGIPTGGETPLAQEAIPGLSQGSNVASRGISLQAPEAGLTGQNYIDGNAMPGEFDDYGNALGRAPSAVSSGGNQVFLSGMGAEADIAGPGVAGASGGTYGATGSPFSLSNLMNNPMGAVKSAYDTVSKNPIPSMYAAGSLYDMYAKNKMAEAQKGMYNQNRADIMNTYAPGSPEYNLLAQQMARKDAAAGRNSQYGARANDLAGTIAKLRMGALGNLQQGQNALGNQALSNQYGMFNTPLMLAAYSAKT